MPPGLGSDIQSHGGQVALHRLDVLDHIVFVMCPAEFFDLKIGRTVCAGGGQEGLGIRQGHPSDEPESPGSGKVLIHIEVGDKLCQVGTVDVLRAGDSDFGAHRVQAVSVGVYDLLQLHLDCIGCRLDVGLELSFVRLCPLPCTKDGHQQSHHCDNDHDQPAPAIGHRSSHDR